MELEAVDTEEELDLLKSYIEEHVAMTGSTVGAKVLEGWPASAAQFVKARTLSFLYIYVCVYICI